MKPRDRLFEVDHFEAFIERRRAEIARRPLSDIMYLPEILSAMYSAGYPLDQIRPVYAKYLEAIAERMQNSYPNPMDATYLMSFALMMGVRDGERDMLAAVAAKDNCNEPFQGFLEDTLGLEHPPITAKKGDLWRFYPPMRDIPDNQNKQEFAAHYLKRAWYNSNRSEHWWGYHTGGAIYYFGYWAWEFGGLVKAWGLDDSSFRTNRYYPADMAHYLDTQN